jgi:hypothetical protein
MITPRSVAWLLALTACGSGARNAPSAASPDAVETTTTTTTTTTAAGAPSASSASPSTSPANGPANAPVYSADEAVRDALASPLTLVGIGGWYGYFRHLSCVYKNARVMVVDMRCEQRETYQLKAIIESPTRGRVEIVADARNKSAAVSTVRRADYEVFGIEGAGPWSGPTPLALSMGYDDMASSYEQRSSKSGGCALTPQKPQGICSARASYTAPAFLAANGHFFEAPPDGWYALVRALVSARASSYAATDLHAASAKQLAAWGGAIGFEHAIDISENVVPFVGQRDRFASVVATADGGMALVGTRRGTQVVVARTDHRGASQWESVLSEAGIREEGDTSLVAASDGFVVHAQGYTSPGLKARHRLVKIDARGRVQWRWVPSDKGPIAVPQFFRAGITPQGTVVIDGYVQTEKDGPVRGWTAEVSAAGKTLREEVGSVELGAKNSKP